MSRAFLAILLAAALSSASAQGSERVRFTGDALAKEERQYLLRVIPRSFSGSLLVRKADIDGDGRADLVLFSPGNRQAHVFLHHPERGDPPYEVHSGGLRVPMKRIAASEEPAFVPGLVAAQKDILIRTGAGCGVLRLAPRSIDSFVGLEAERFDCAWSNREYLVRRTECRAGGGQWRPAGSIGYVSCELPTADAGKACSDSSECQNECIYAGPLPPPASGVTGACSASTAKRACAPMVTKGEVLSWCIE